MKRMLALILSAFFLFMNTVIVFAKPMGEKIGDIINTPPMITLKAVRPKKLVDIIIVTDYTGVDYAKLEAAINDAKARLMAVNVDPVFNVITDMKKVGTQRDVMYKWVRRAGVTAVFDYHLSYTTGHYKSPYYETSSVIIEEKDAPLSQIYNLPKRSPTNIRETHTYISWEDNSNKGDGYVYYVDFDNDVVNRVGPIKIYQNFESYKSPTWYTRGELIKSTPFVTDWIPETPLGDSNSSINYDVLSLDFDKVMSINLRPNSDRYMLFVSEGISKNYSNAKNDKGKFFSFGAITPKLAEYIKNNNFVTLAALGDGIDNMLLTDEKVAEVQPIGSATVFKMVDGSYKKIGGYLYQNLDWSMPKDYKDIGKVKESFYDGKVLMEDGRLLIYDAKNDKFNIFDGLTNVKAVYPSEDWDNKNEEKIPYFIVERNSGSLYHYRLIDENEYESMYLGSISGSIKRLMNIGRLYSVNNDVLLILSSSGYIYCSYLDDISKDSLSRLKIARYLGYWNYTSQYELVNMPSVKNAYFISDYFNSNSNLIVLYDNGKLVRGGIRNYLSINGTYQEGKFMVETVIDEDVEELYNTGQNVLYKKRDGTYWIEACRKTGNFNYVFGPKYKIDNKTILNVVDSDIGVAFISTTNGTYITKGKWYDDNPDELIKIGNYQTDYVKPLAGLIEVNSEYQYLLLKTTSDEFYTIEFCTYWFWDDDYNKYHGKYESSSKLNFKIKDIKYIYSGICDKYTKYPQTAIVITDDNRPRGFGASTTGQLGKIGLFNRFVSSGFINPFYNNITLIDSNLKDITFSDIMKDSIENLSFGSKGYDLALNEICRRYEYSDSGLNYIVLGDAVDYKTEYSDYENDPEYSRKWNIVHDPYYFDNSMGLSAYHGKETAPPNVFDKVGKYTIKLKARDNPKSDLRFLNDTDENKNYYKWSEVDNTLILYVHRRPIPVINLNITKNQDGTWSIVATDGGSYDLDHTSRADKGIVEWEWAWRDQFDDMWRYQQMNINDATADRTYTVALRVKDIEGVWSDWTYQTIDNRQPPIAKFDLVKNSITTIEKAQIIDTSYAIMSNLTDWHWIVKKINDNGTIGATLQDIRATESNTGAGGYDTTLDIARTNPGVGRYRIYLRVKADNGLWSDGGTDAAANINNMFYRDLTINQALEIEDISIVGRWNHFRGWTDKFGVYKDVMKDVTYVDEKGKNCYPYRFLSYEKIDISIKLEGYADKVIIDFPDGLDRMTYTDKLGYTYSYREDVGYMVSFPYEIEIDPTLKDPEISWSYILPLVDSTVTWNNIRVKQPYTIRITAIKGTYEVIQEKKIDITGNVDDLIFIQPVAR